jgi:hypothetical protein
MARMPSQRGIGSSTGPFPGRTIGTVFLLTCGTLILVPGIAAQRSERIGRPVRGETAPVRVPMVAAPWDATISAVPPKPQKRVWFVGRYPGYSEFKQQANARRKGLADLPRGTRGSANNSAKPMPRPLASSSTTQGIIFEGPSESDTNEIPPDSQVAAGPNYLVVGINSLLAIYDKSGNLQGSFQSFSSFFGSLGITGSIYDPRIIYDQTDQRFILSAAEVDFTNLTNGHVLLAVSASNDPTATWYKFAIDFKGRNPANTANTFPDFPGLGLSQSAVYITTNQFELTQACVSTDTEQCYFSDAQIKVIGLPELLAGNPNLNITAFTNVQTADGFPAVAIQPALTYGSANDEFLVAARFDAYTGTALNLFAIPTSGTPTLSTADLSVPPYTFPPDALQAGTYATILTDDYRPLNAVWANGSLYCTQNVSAVTTYGVVARWYQIQVSDLASASLTQSGDVAGNGDAYYPAISQKADGSISLAFTTSSHLQFASAAFTGREASDPLGTMRGYSLYHSGTGSYDEEVGNRWGDYSGISEDPDGSNLWMIAEYAGTPDPHFGTAVAQITSPPALLVSPSSLTFQNSQPGTTISPMSVTLTNVSSGSVAIGTLTLSGVNAGNFSLSSDPCSATSLPAGQSCTVSVTFNTSTFSTWEDALLSIPYGTGGLVTVGLEGFEIAKAILSFTPNPLVFPPTLVQTASAPMAVTLTNSGNAPTGLSLLQVGGDFTQTNNCGSSLAAGASCTFSVIFHPTTSGLDQGDISFGGTADNPNIFVTLSGAGTVAPAALFCPPSVSFSNQAINSASAPQPVMLTNNGSATLNITKISTAGDFSATSDCVGGVPARGSCLINVTFTPAASGSRTGTLTVTDDAPSSPQSVSLAGTGTAGSSSLLMIPSEVAAVLRQSNARSVTGAGKSSVQANVRERQRPARHALYFEPNVGQLAADVEFLSRAGEGDLALNKSGLELRLAPRPPRGSAPRPQADQRGHDDPRSARVTSARAGPRDPVTVNMTLVGANAAVRASGREELPGKSNYFIGNDPSRWRTNVPTYAQVRLEHVYPGIDLVYYGNQNRLEYDFVVAPHANPNSIALKFQGQTPLHFDSRSGDLVLATRAGDVRFHKPVVYQPSLPRSSLVSRHLSLVDCHYRLVGNRLTFKVGAYDKTKPLIIDPIMSFSTYLAGSVEDAGNAIAVDASGNVYVAGSTLSPDFPLTSGAFKKNCGSPSNACVDFESQPDAFASKLSPDGSLIYSTFLGGGGADVAKAIALDSSGNAYVTGSTLSADFPVTQGAFQTTCPGTTGSCGGGFVTKLNPSGSALVYSTYLGGISPAGPDQSLAIGVDASGDAFVGGLAMTLDFPTTPGAFQTTVTPAPLGPGNGHGFLTKLNPVGTSLVFSTYLGGSNTDQVNGLAVDSSGDVYVAGQTNSLDFPTTPGAFQTGSYHHTYGGESFISKLSPSGSILYATYFSGPGFGNGSGTQARAIAVDSTGAPYVAGSTLDALPTTPGSYETVPFYVGSAFLTKLHPAGCGLLYSTFVGYNLQGFQGFGANGIALDSSNDVYLTGNADLTIGPGLSAPTLVNGLQPPLSAPSGGSSTVLLSELNPTGSEILFSSFLGGSGGNTSGGIAVDPAGNIYVTGATNAPDFPMANALQPTCPACEFDKPVGTGVFVTKISPQPANAVLLTRNALTFAPNAVGSSNVEVLTVGLMNQLTTPLKISSVNVNGNDFSLLPGGTFGSLPCTGSIAPGAGCIAQVQYSPNALGQQSGILAVSDDGPGSPRIITLNATGLADFKLETGASSVTALKGTETVQFGIGATQIPAAPVPSGDIALSCAGVAPATCTFNPASIPIVAGSSTLSVSGLSAVAGNILNFSAVGTLSGQTYSLPLTIFLQDFTLSTSESSATVTPGQSAKYSFTVTPAGGFNYEVSFSCSGVPPLATCSISPIFVTLDGTNPATVQVTVTTTAPSSTYPGEPRLLPPAGMRPWQWVTWLLILILLSVALAASRARVRRAWLGIALIVMIGGAWVSCGGGGGGGSNPGTSPGTYAITVAGTYAPGSNTLSHNITLTLKVQ